jgi:hypothetical protein
MGGQKVQSLIARPRRPAHGRQPHQSHHHGNAPPPRASSRHGVSLLVEVNSVGTPSEEGFPFPHLARASRVPDHDGATRRGSTHAPLNARMAPVDRVQGDRLPGRQ